MYHFATEQFENPKFVYTFECFTESLPKLLRLNEICIQMNSKWGIKVNETIRSGYEENASYSMEILEWGEDGDDDVDEEEERKFANLKDRNNTRLVMYFPFENVHAKRGASQLFYFARQISNNIKR